MVSAVMRWYRVTTKALTIIFGGDDMVRVSDATDKGKMSGDQGSSFDVVVELKVTVSR
jgi:hypothetical protein